MSRIALVLLASALAAPSALAMQKDAATAGSVEAASAGVAPKSRIVCRTSPTLGTRLGGKRECAPAEEWERIRAEQREVLQKQQTLGHRGE
jgi:hypothetical protein